MKKTNRVDSQSNYHSATTTKRELEILMSLAHGNKSSDISVQLNISINTVETHRKNLLRKFRARNSAQLVFEAVKSGQLQTT